MRSLINLILGLVYAVRTSLFVFTRFFGSIPVAVAVIGLSIVYIETHPREPKALIFFPVFFVVFCYHAYPKLRVRSRPNYRQAPAPPPPPPPSASTAKGRSDDPDEATVVGRLDPKLRDLLRQKKEEQKAGGAAASR